MQDQGFKIPTGDNIAILACALYVAARTGEYILANSSASSQQIQGLLLLLTHTMGLIQWAAIGALIGQATGDLAYMTSRNKDQREGPSTDGEQ